MRAERRGQQRGGRGGQQRATERALGQESQSLASGPAQAGGRLWASVSTAVQRRLDQMASSSVSSVQHAFPSTLQPSFLPSFNQHARCPSQCQGTQIPTGTQLQGGVGYKGSCRTSAGTHTPDPTESSQVREGCLQWRNSMCKRRHAERMLPPETRRSPRCLEGKTGGKAAGPALGPPQTPC